jgi:serine/threonine protein phosphatase 1
MATIAVGDIHGNLPALADLLGQIAGEAGDGDTVVFLGDYIDRGTHTKACVDAILAFQRETKADVVCLCGNHEDWLLRTLHDYGRHSWLLGMEALDTIWSYSPAAANVLREAVSAAGIGLVGHHMALPYDVFFDAVPKAHLRFFESLVSYHQTLDCLCVHGGVDPRVSHMHDQTREALTWGGEGFPNQYDGAETVVYGHWNNAQVDAQGWPTPTIIGRTIGIDTIAHGVLTAIRLPDRRLFQSAQFKAGRLHVQRTVDGAEELKPEDHSQR